MRINASLKRPVEQRIVTFDPDWIPVNCDAVSVAMGPDGDETITIESWPDTEEIVIIHNIGDHHEILFSALVGTAA